MKGREERNEEWIKEWKRRWGGPSEGKEDEWREMERGSKWEVREREKAKIKERKWVESQENCGHRKIENENGGRWYGGIQRGEVIWKGWEMNSKKDWRVEWKSFGEDSENGSKNVRDYVSKMRERNECMKGMRQKTSIVMWGWRECGIDPQLTKTITTVLLNHTCSKTWTTSQLPPLYKAHYYTTLPPVPHTTFIMQGNTFHHVPSGTDFVLCEHQPSFT